MTGWLEDESRSDADRDGVDRLVALEAEVRGELAVADASPAIGVFSSPESEWLVDPAELQVEQTGLRSLLGAVRALEAGRDPR